MKKQSWLTYNDLDVSETQEAVVQRDRDRSGYIFFYMHKWVVRIMCTTSISKIIAMKFVVYEHLQYIVKNTQLFEPH